MQLYPDLFGYKIVSNLQVERVISSQLLIVEILHGTTIYKWITT